jgi:hypothetical protein
MNEYKATDLQIVIEMEGVHPFYQLQVVSHNDDIEIALTIL